MAPRLQRPTPQALAARARMHARCRADAAGAHTTHAGRCTHTGNQCCQFTCMPEPLIGCASHTPGRLYSARALLAEPDLSERPHRLGRGGVARAVVRRVVRAPSHAPPLAWPMVLTHDARCDTCQPSLLLRCALFQAE
eukprot:6197784-Pleurochrysis_carterae.AAC.1